MSAKIPDVPDHADLLKRGEFVKLAYRLGRARATGVLTLYPPAGRTEVLVVRRGFLLAARPDEIGTHTRRRLARLASIAGLRYVFDGGTAAYPPGAQRRQFALAAWARRHIEAQLDATRAQRMVDRLAGVRLVIVSHNAPDPRLCDETDRRILEAMVTPRRLDQICSIARTPRFRLISFLYFLRAVDGVSLIGVAAPAPAPALASDAHALLGVEEDADRATVKRAYRRLARALHPDLQPHVSEFRRKTLERQLADVTSAYVELTGSLPL